jgi:hypothetical protein
MFEKSLVSGEISLTPSISVAISRALALISCSGVIKYLRYLLSEVLGRTLGYLPLLAGFTALTGVFGLSVGGRPMRTLRSISSTLGSYTASLVIGWTPAVSIRFRVASMEIFNSLAISDTVIPSIPSLSDILQEKFKKVSNFLEILLDKVSNMFDSYL